ncbi:hypothetical protein [Streptomyces sp. NPDC002676]
MTWNEFLEACQEWLDGRDEATRAAYWEVRRKAGNDYHVLEYEDLARRARHDAGVQYELTVPRPEWNGEPGGGNNARLRYVTEADVAAAQSEVAA